MHEFADKQYTFCRQRGKGGSKNPKILWTSYMEAPSLDDSSLTLAGKRKRKVPEWKIRRGKLFDLMSSKRRYIFDCIAIFQCFRRNLISRWFITHSSSPIWPHCQVIWCNTKSKVLDPLIKAQKRVLRIVNNEHWLKHCDPLFASMDCIKLTDQYKISCGKLVVKFLQKTLPPGLQSCFHEKTQVRSTRMSENNRLLIQQKTKDPTVLRMPKYSIAQVWNKYVPKSFKDLQEVSFNLAYKNQFIQEYSNFKCTKRNCYSCESRFIR